jgi:hypothetical protein
VYVSCGVAYLEIACYGVVGSVKFKINISTKPIYRMGNCAVIVVCALLSVRVALSTMKRRQSNIEGVPSPSSTEKARSNLFNSERGSAWA